MLFHLARYSLLLKDLLCSLMVSLICHQIFNLVTISRYFLNPCFYGANEVLSVLTKEGHVFYSSIAFQL